VMTEKSQNYAEVLKAFERINDKLNFEKRIELAKANNQNVWFELATKYYIISNTSWIEIPSEDTKVLINNEKSILAKDLNSEIKRNSIKHMTTLRNSENKVVIYMK
jgi:fructose-1,6-bisphosphatase